MDHRPVSLKYTRQPAEKTRYNGTLCDSWYFMICPGFHLIRHSAIEINAGHRRAVLNASAKGNPERSKP
jgi:hypothetical protein